MLRRILRSWRAFKGAATLWLGADNVEQHAGGHAAGNGKGGEDAEDREEGELNVQLQSKQLEDSEDWAEVEDKAEASGMHGSLS